ncbi:MAG TPA: hypothetical protein VFO01_18280 [Trebonia sp.]|nr:hypothetical protein [Trebonia sp.]
MSIPRKPDLEQLITALTADGRPEELAGRDAALAAFRGARQRNAAGETASRHRGLPLRRPLTGLSARLTALGAALIVAAGMAAAAYAQALPDPVQRLAHTVFAPLGIPDGQQPPGQPSPGTAPPGGSGSTGVTISRAGGKTSQATCPCPRTSAKAPSPRPRAGYLITVGVSRARVPAGGVVVFTGRVTDQGRAAASVRVWLFARVAGSAQFELAAVGATGPLGGFRLSSPPLTATTFFRVTGPDSAHSVAVKVVAVPPEITARAAGDAPGPVAME